MRSVVVLWVILGLGKVKHNKKEMTKGKLFFTLWEGKKAQEILNQSNQTMRLENQETNSLSQELELERLTKDLLYRMPSQLWD